MVSKQAKGLFHKAIVQSATTSYEKEAYKQTNKASTSKHTSWNIINQIIKDKSLNIIQEDNNTKIKNLLKNMSAKDFLSITHKGLHMKI